MAIRFSADGQDLTRALAMGTLGAISVSCWFKISVDRNSWSTPWFIDAGTGDNWGIQTSSDGVTMGVVDGGTTLQNMGSLTVGVWYWTCLVMNGATGTLYHKLHGANTINQVAISGGTADVLATTLRIGESPWGTEWLNGCVGPFKFWVAPLGAAEVATESHSIEPVRTAGLAASYSFERLDLLDRSGNARTLAGTGPTYEPGPPLVQRITVRRWLVDAGGGDLTLMDQSVGCALLGATASTLSLDVVLTDTPGGMRAASAADSAVIGVVHTDSTGSVRATGMLGETATTALVVLDLNTGQIRLGTVGGETVTQGTALTDPSPWAVRAGSTRDALTYSLTFADTAGPARTGEPESSMVSTLVFADAAGSARSSGATDDLIVAGPVTKANLDTHDRSGPTLAVHSRPAPALTVADRSGPTMTEVT